MSSYIQYLHSSGARIVPLIYGADLNATLEKLEHLNGVFYAGGANNDNYTAFGKAIFDKVVQMNDEGKFVPIWGTCLGFENMAEFTTSEGNVLSNLKSEHVNQNLTFLLPPEHTKLF